MALTLGFTSMDKATETALRAAFDEANTILQDRFTLATDGSAGFVIIDMDSMYGPMGWLRLHAAGKQVVGLTSAARTQADFRLGRPFDTAAMVELLREIAASAGEDVAAPADSAAAQATATEAADAPAPAPEVASPQPEAESDAEAGAETGTGPDTDARPATEAEALPEPGPIPEPAASAEAASEPEPAASQSAPPAPEAAADAPADGITGAETPLPPAPAQPEAADAPEPIAESPAATTPEPEPEPQPELEPPPRDPVFADWMAPGALSGRVRYRHDEGPELWIDADAHQYHGPQQLKPLAAYFEGTVQREDFESVDDDAWSTAVAAAGEPQPMLRLQWLGGLLAGGGELLPGHDPEGRYHLTKWPQTEREYPRHFRIATAMMKAPATLAEVAEASGMPLAEVADFTNANLATGYAEFVPEPEPEPDSPPKPAGFFSRLRGRS